MRVVGFAPDAIKFVRFADVCEFSNSFLNFKKDLNYDKTSALIEEIGVVRHVDAGYTEAIEFAEKNNVVIPMKN
jgi:hypothetical protein